MPNLEVDGPNLTALAVALRADHPEIYRLFRKQLGNSGKVLLEAERSAVKGLTFSTTSRAGLFGWKSTTVQGRGGTGGTSAARRAAATSTRDYADAVATGKKVVSAKAFARLKSRSGLRDSIARGMRSGVTQSRAKGVEVKVQTSARTMPPGQKNLPRYVNAGKWRHPVFASGNRRKWDWVEQRPDTPGWWEQTGLRAGPAAKSAIVGGLDNVSREIAAQAEKASK